MHLEFYRIVQIRLKIGKLDQIDRYQLENAIQEYDNVLCNPQHCSRKQREPKITKAEGNICELKSM